MDFDPRDVDSRDDQRWEHEREHRSGGRDADDGLDDWGLSEARSRDRDAEHQALALGRGPSDNSKPDHGAEPRDDPRWGERDRDARERDQRDRDARDRDRDPREVFTRHLDLPRGLERELVRDRDRSYTLRGSESRTLATVGAFRVVSSRDLRDHRDRPTDPRSGDLRHLREQGLIHTVRVAGSREHAVALTREGRQLLERHRDRSQGDRQTFWDGLKREREREHDLQVFRAYERAARKLADSGRTVERVVLDHELKREYQTWLHERGRDRSDYDGHPDRTDDEIRDWARERDLPYFDEEVHFPDARIEYREPDGRWDHDDIEVTTAHYRGAHAASVGRSGFSTYGGSTLRIGGRSGGGRGGGRHGGLAEEYLD